MKKNILFILLAFCFQSFSQTLEDKLENIASYFATKLANEDNFTIAIYPFSYLKSNEENLAIHVFEELHTTLKQKERNFSIMDRETFEIYLAEHKLNSEGLIDKKTAKEFGQLIAADAYVTGKTYIFGSVIKLTVSITNTQTGEIIAFISEKIPIDYDTALFLGLKDWDKNRKKAEEFKSQNNNCNRLQVGDYCFYNNTSGSCEIYIQKSSDHFNYANRKKIVIQPHSKACLYDLKTGKYLYTIYRTDRPNIAGRSNILKKGSFTIKKCESQVEKIASKNTKFLKQGISGYEKPLCTITISNPNAYGREIMFINKDNEYEKIIIGANSTSQIELPQGHYKFISKTTFSKTVVEQTNFTLSKAKKMKLKLDHYN